MQPGHCILAWASASEQPQNVAGNGIPPAAQVWHTLNGRAKPPPGQSGAGVGGEAFDGVPVLPVEYHVIVVSLWQ